MQGKFRGLHTRYGILPLFYPLSFAPEVGKRPLIANEIQLCSVGVLLNFFWCHYVISHVQMTSLGSSSLLGKQWSLYCLWSRYTPPKDYPATLKFISHPNIVRWAKVGWMAPMPTEAQIFLQTPQSFFQVILFQGKHGCLSKESSRVSNRTSMLVSFSLHSQAKKLTLKN